MYQEESHAINVSLVHRRDAYWNTTSRYKVSSGALQRHALKHLPKLLVKTKDTVEVAEADSL